MFVEQIYTNCLAEASYYIESNGEAAIIDPVREPDMYLALAESRGAKIKYVFETHFHADFVSGHLDLASKTQAKIVFGPTAQPAYEAHIGADGESFKIGELEMLLIHTPGHTPESSTFLLRDEAGKDHAIFTGDTLFIGDVGRPDLLDAIISKEELGAMLYDSLHQKIMPLADEVIVYPGHGPGSACGKQIGKETVSTLGAQKATNYALQPMDKATFIKTVTDGQPAAPSYFFMDVQMNKNGYDSIDAVMERSLKALTPHLFIQEATDKTFIIDTRSKEDFARGFVPRSVNIPLDGSFALWAGAVIPTDAPLLIVTEEGKEQETVLRLARVGYENVSGYLQGGISAWEKAGQTVAKLAQVSAAAFAEIHEPYVIDVRGSGEWNNGHLVGAKHLCTTKLSMQLNDVPTTGDVYMHCQSGYRSSLVVSWLMRAGWTNLIDIQGGFKALSEIHVPIESAEVVCA